MMSAIIINPEKIKQEAIDAIEGLTIDFLTLMNGKMVNQKKYTGYKKSIEFLSRYSRQKIKYKRLNGL